MALYNRFSLTMLAVVLAWLAPAATAGAASVSVGADLWQFAGVVGSDGQFTTYIDQHNGLGPEELCPDAGCGSGIGSAYLGFDGLPQEDFFFSTSDLEFWNTDFGVERTRNRITFESAGPSDVDLGEEFLWGTLTFTNGIWFTDPEFTISFYSSSSDPLFDAFLWTDTIHLSVTPNTSADPRANADYIWFTGSTFLGSIRAFELNEGGNTVTAEIYGAISSLDPTRLANATGGGFLDPSVEALPEPTTGVSIALGLVASALARKRARKA